MDKTKISRTLDDKCFHLESPKTEQEWNEYHRIRKTEIFDQLENIEYDYNHPSLRSENCYHFCFYLSDKIIGAIMFELLESHHRAAIRTIAIDKDYQNKGFGSILLKLTENKLKELDIKTIHVHANPKAYKFYKNNGYIDMEFRDDVGIGETIDVGKLLK